MVDLAVLYQGAKQIPVQISWTETDSEKLTWVSAVEIDGVAIEGLRLRLTAMRSMPGEAVTCQLEYHEQRKLGGPICRIDWRPIHDHNNKGRGPQALHHKLLRGSHHHSFEINWLYAASMVRRGNLPIATPMEDNDPRNFAELLAFLEQELRISGLRLLVVPPWQPSLF